MASNATVARPYAKATFALAVGQSALAEWSQRLEALAGVVADDAVVAVISNPSLTYTQKGQIVVDCLGEQGAVLQGLVMTLAEYGRLSVAEEIKQQYELLRSTSEQTLDAEVVSARALDDTQQQALVDALGQRFGCAVTIQSTVDESLIGGAIIRAGDVVIDGSIKGRLDRLELAAGS